MSPFYDTFKMAYDKRYNSVRFRDVSYDYVGTSTYIWPLDRYFIDCMNTEDISKVFNLIHEYGHVLQYAINPLDLYLNKQGFTSEVASIFPELIARYENVGNFNQTQLFFDDFITLTSYFGYAINLILHSPIVNLYNEHNRKISEGFFSDAEEYYDLDSEGLKSSLDTYIDSEGLYVFSYMVAIELFHIYKQDKNKALLLYDKIIRMPYYEDSLEYVNKLLPLGKSLKEETETIIKNLSLTL